MSKIMLLSNGEAVLVDNDDFEFLNHWKWKKHRQGYACRTGYIDGKYKLLLMHRIINQTPSHLEVDHINRNKLDNRKINLRAVNRSENEINKDLCCRNTSGYKGVTWDKSREKWSAKIKHDGTFYNLGRFDTAKEAAIAYNSAAKVLFGKYAFTNRI